MIFLGWNCGTQVFHRQIMPEYSFLTKEDVINLVPFFHKLFIFMFYHKLLQSIVRSKSNRSMLFNSKIFIRQFSFKRSLSKFRKIKLIRFSPKIGEDFLLLAIYNSTASIQERSTKNNRTCFANFRTKHKKISRILSLST